MSSHGSCGEVRQALAVYVLGAIEPGGRDVVEGHLAECAGCRDELAGLASLPSLLRRVSPQEASALLGDDMTAARPADLPSGPALRHLLARAGRARCRLRARSLSDRPPEPCLVTRPQGKSGHAIDIGNARIGPCETCFGL